MEELFETLDRHRRDRGDAIALADESTQISYSMLPDAIRRRREQISTRQIRVLAIDIDNSVEWVLWDLAAASAGIVCVPIAPFFSAQQRDHVLDAAGVDTIVTAIGLESYPTKSATDHIPVVIHTGTAKITFTSGTTGTPKGVCLSFAGLQTVARSVYEALPVERLSVHFCAMPLAILLENVAGVYAALFAGCRIELCACASTWTDSKVLAANLARCRANTVILVPELLRGLLAVVGQYGEAGARPLADLEFMAVGGSHVSPQLISDARVMGLPVYEGYGLSECGSVVALSRPGLDRAGAVGRLLPHVDVRIENEEIVIGNPLCLGYLDDEPMGTLYTGDVGDIDDDGFVTIKGRSRNVLVTSYGRNISPEWIEALLLNDPVIAQALVCGDGWPLPGALIVAADNVADESINHIIESVNQQLPDTARICAWLRVPPFTPHNGLLTATGRPRREPIHHKYLHALEKKMNQVHVNDNNTNTADINAGKQTKQEFFERLVAASEKPRNRLYQVPQLIDGINGRISRQTYIAYLTEAYHHVSHTVPFLMAMGARLPRDKHWLQSAIIEYINEEKGHEQWILNDIEACGGDPSVARNSIPNLATQVLVAYNHDYITRRNPVGFLGMVYMLESTSTQMATRGASSIQTTLDLPDSAFSYLYSHGTLDEQHMNFYRKLVNQIDDPDDQRAIIEVACNTFELFAALLSSIPHQRLAEDAA
ncbi:MAG: hypothetical protein DHS20C01_11950 [marine bacterium B5-7]|nr:MAG: hypothetical protein DHS20C01_11950 [marine bacterium B5-7]